MSVKAHTLRYFIITGNVSALEINSFDFPPDNHTLTINFIDEQGNMGSFQFNFTSEERPGEC